MEKTTVYVPSELKAKLAKIAARSGVSEASLIRQGIEHVVESATPPRPRLGIFNSGDPMFARRVEEELQKGFGRD